MQDRYAGDVGDFGKFSLLRALCNDSDQTLGVVWYLFPDENHNGDGRHIDYIKDPRYWNCDKGLVECLSKVVAGERSVAHLEKLDIFPVSTIYFSERLDFHKTYSSQTTEDKANRFNGRKRWIENAVKCSSDCDIVFVDPDNGIEVNSIPKVNQMKSGKYTYISELLELFRNKDACVVYHHLSRNQTHKAQMEYRAKQLKDSIDGVDRVFALRFFPYSPRAFFIVTAKSYTNTVRKKIASFYQSPCGFGWDTHFEY